MKNLFVLLLFISCTITLVAQTATSNCCQNKFTNFTIDQSFDHLGSCLVPRAIRNKYYGDGAVGRKDGGQFIVPAPYMAEILRVAYNATNNCYNPRCIMDMLGVQGTSWSEDPQWVRFDFKDLKALHVRLPDSTNPGANPLFKYGGFTDCGIPERVIDQASLVYISDSMNISICVSKK